MRVTALIGAGATIEVGGIPTCRLTAAARRTIQQAFDPSQPGVVRHEQFIDQLADHLDGVLRASADRPSLAQPPIPDFFGRRCCNFEQVLHVLEVLQSYATGPPWPPDLAVDPLVASVVAPSNPRWGDRLLLAAAIGDLIRAVADEIVGSCERFQPSGRDAWWAEFWRGAVGCCPWDLVTLNYDTLLEQSLSGWPIEDGFVDTGRGFSRLDEPRIRGTDLTRILHLHGSICLGHVGTTADANALRARGDSRDDLYKYPDPRTARETWAHRGSSRAQSGDEIRIGPLIAGLRKADKLLSEPYATYFAEFRAAVHRSPALVVAGYSFGDQHINQVLSRYRGRCPTDRPRVVVVGRCPEPEEHWWRSPDHWMPAAMFDFLGRTAQPEDLFGINPTFSDPWVSSDGCVRGYFRGMKAAVQEHGQEILDFLTS